MKISLLTGLAAGVASASLYVLFSGDKADKGNGEETSTSERLDQNEKEKRSADADDAEDLEVIKRMLADELKSHANTPNF